MDCPTCNRPLITLACMVSGQSHHLCRYCGTVASYVADAASSEAPVLVYQCRLLASAGNTGVAEMLRQLGITGD